MLASLAFVLVFLIFCVNLNLNFVLISAALLARFARFASQQFKNSLRYIVVNYAACHIQALVYEVKSTYKGLYSDMAKAPGIHYVDNKKFYATIADHRRKLKEAREQGKPEPKIPDYIGECIYNIAKKLATKACFASYSFRDEMVSDAIENCILYYESFDPDYGENAFSYFTQVVYYAFIRRINMEQKNRYTMYKYFSEAVAECNNSGLFVDSDGNHLLTKQVYDNINDFMVRYEEKELKKKHKRKVAKEAKNSLARFAEEKQPDGADNQ